MQIGMSIFLQLYMLIGYPHKIPANSLPSSSCTTARQPRKAVSLTMTERKDCEESEEEDSEDTEAVIEKLLAIRENCHLKAKANIDAAQEKQKKQYDSKHNALKVS